MTAPASWGWAPCSRCGIPKWDVDPCGCEPQAPSYQSSPYVRWNDRQLKRITVCDTYLLPGNKIHFGGRCYGELADGTPCFVVLPFTVLRRDTMRKEINEFAQKDNVWVKRIGLMKAIKEQ